MKIRGGEAVGAESLAQLGFGLERGQAQSIPRLGDCYIRIRPPKSNFL